MSYSLFSGITSGLTSTYSILASATTSNVTASTIASAMSSSTYAATLGSSGFASYMMQNFSAFDANGDGVLSSQEMANFNNIITARGMTASQLSQLGSASGLSGNTLEQVLQHFNDIDANGDGRVTSAEVEAYKLKSTMDQKKTEFSNRAAKNQSVFYGDENASSEADSSSMLSFKYWQNGSNGSTSGSSNV